MPTIEESVDIEASPESVSDVLLDPDAAPLWTEGLERLELVEGVAGLAGSVGLAHYIEGDRRYTLEDHLLEAEPGRHFKSEVRGGGLKVVVETNLEPVPDGTRTTMRWSGTGTNPLTWLMLPFLRKSVRQRCRSDLEALQALVERRVDED
jgi:hypothetical protein